MEIQYAMRHPNIVEVLAFELGDRGHAPCLVMERMDESLYTMLGASIDIGGVSKVSIVRDVCEVCIRNRWVYFVSGIYVQYCRREGTNFKTMVLKANHKVNEMPAMRLVFFALFPPAPGCDVECRRLCGLVPTDFLVLY